MKYGEQDDGPLPHVYARYTARGLIGGKWQNENALTINDIVKARSMCRFAIVFVWDKLELHATSPETSARAQTAGTARGMLTLTSSFTVHAS
jgi:hypothetical protein